MSPERDELLDDVVEELLQQHVAAPPQFLRAAVLDAARRQPPQLPLSPPVVAYLHQADAFSALASALTVDDWQRRAAPYSWNLHGLVAHLLQVERYMQRVVGLAAGAAEPAEIDHLALGADEIASEMRREPIETLGSWRSEIERVRSSLTALDLARVVQFHRWPFSIGSLLVARAFELWTHADDIRRAVGRPLATPGDPDVRVMSDTSVRGLPLAIHVVRDQVPDGRARVVLTGTGGGTWDLQLGAGGPELVTIITDAVDYCRVAARRLDVSSLVAEIDGDRELADGLFAAATIVAV